MYKAIKHNDFYYLVEGESYHDDFIEITKDEYDYFLKNNQEHGYVVRMSKGSLISCKVEQPTEFHRWNEEIGEWEISPENLSLSQSQALEVELNQLKQDLVFAQAMGDDISDIVARVKEVREELEKLK